MLNGTNVFTVSGLPGTPTADETFAIRDYIMNQLWQNAPDNVDFYWESYGGVNKPNTILAVSATRQTSSNTLTIDATTTDAVESSISQSFVPDIDGGKLCCNRLLRGSYRSKLRSSTFAKTASSSPISAIAGATRSKFITMESL